MVTSHIKETKHWKQIRKNGVGKESCNVRLSVDSLTSMLSFNKGLNRDVEARPRGRQAWWV